VVKRRPATRPVPLDRQLIGCAASAETVAQLLARGSVGGVAVGRAEAGPRALGHRSILADARSISSREVINGLIKRREAFRPLAPICLEDEFDKYFVRPAARVPLDLMLFAVRCRPECRAILPAIVHSDGTARVQVASDPSEFVYGVLTAFREITGVGVLINTSFNCPGEPLVDTADHALRSFVRLGLDFVVIGDLLVAAPSAFDLIPQNTR
jgi:carbamoyltransferase